VVLIDLLQNSSAMPEADAAAFVYVNNLNLIHLNPCSSDKVHQKNRSAKLTV